jgi:hypothetical protein
MNPGLQGLRLKYVTLLIIIYFIQNRSRSRAEFKPRNAEELEAALSIEGRPGATFAPVSQHEPGHENEEYPEIRLCKPEQPTTTK